MGKILQELREDYGARQDDLARAARGAGVPWTASSVAALETGRRALTLDEACQLASIFGRLGLAAAAIARRSPPGALEIRADKDRILISLFGRSVAQDTGLRWEQSLAQLRAGEQAFKAFPDVTREIMAAARDDEDGVLEQRIARRFKVHGLTVAVAARLSWGRGLTEERDRRSAAAVAGRSRRAGQTLRGHVTRDLLAELAPRLRNVPKNVPATASQRPHSSQRQPRAKRKTPG